MKKRRAKLKYVNPYKTENELCNVLIKYARANGWKIYPETSGFDILLVKNIQIGIQAKNKDNIEVLSQSLSNDSSNGPHLIAVLVPKASKDFKRVAKALKIFVIEGVHKKLNTRTLELYWAKEIITKLDGYDKKYLRTIKKTAWIPEFEIDTPAGVKSPKRITEWKLKAVKLCVKLEKQGFLTSHDFKEAGVSITLWVIKKWLVDSGMKSGKSVKYIRGKNVKLPDILYPEITKHFKLTD